MDRVDWLSRGDNRESAGMGHQPQVVCGQPAKTWSTTKWRGLTRGKPSVYSGFPIKTLKKQDLSNFGAGKSVPLSPNLPAL